MRPDPDSNTPEDPGHTHREIAELLGIGRARVFFHEKEALKKIRGALGAAGIHSLIDFESVPFSTSLRGGSFKKKQVIPQLEAQFSSQHGWLNVHRVVSINGGSEAVEDVARAFRFLKDRHESIVRPPVIIKSSDRHSYVIQAAAEKEGRLKVRCWPTDGSSRSVGHLELMRCTAIVESEFGTDERGRFDVPILMCIIISGAETGTQVGAVPKGAGKRGRNAGKRGRN